MYGGATVLGLRWRVAAITLALIGATMLLASPALAVGGTQPLQTAVSAMADSVQGARTALANGDLGTARADGQAAEHSWEGVESPIARRDPRAESRVDQALDAANAALDANPPPADTAALLDRLQAALHDLNQALAVAPEAPAANGSQIGIGDAINLLQRTDQSLANGDLGAARQSFDTFQQQWPLLETQLSVESPSTYHQLESQLPSVATSLSGSAANATSARQTVGQMIGELQAVGGQEEQYGPLDAAITLLREGLEALLVIGALLALVTRAGRADLRWQIWAGGGVGIVASLAVAAALQVVFTHFAVGLNRELLEGVTGLGAAAMLLYVSYWLHQQSSLADWRKFLASRTGAALAAGNTFLLPLLAFLAVFREGAETVVLYAGMAASISLHDMILGMGIGLIGLAALGVGLFGFGLRLSLKPFFRVISILLYYLAFKFVGTGIHALQVAGALPATSADYLPSLGAIGLFPTWQTTTAQVLLVAVAVAAIVWVAKAQRRAPEVGG